MFKQPKMWWKSPCGESVHITAVRRSGVRKKYTRHSCYFCKGTKKCRDLQLWSRQPESFLCPAKWPLYVAHWRVTCCQGNWEILCSFIRKMATVRCALTLTLRKSCTTHFCKLQYLQDGHPPSQHDAKVTPLDSKLHHPSHTLAADLLQHGWQRAYVDVGRRDLICSKKLLEDRGVGALDELRVGARLLECPLLAKDDTVEAAAMVWWSEMRKLKSLVPWSGVEGRLSRQAEQSSPKSVVKKQDTPETTGKVPNAEFIRASGGADTPQETREPTDKFPYKAHHGYRRTHVGNWEEWEETGKGNRAREYRYNRLSKDSWDPKRTLQYQRNFLIHKPFLNI